MAARFKNTSRGEYEATGRARQRVIYASWHPDEFKLAHIWVRGFKERIENYDRDEHGVPLLPRVDDEPPLAGDKRVTGREAIARTLGDVTDFIVVATASYFSQQRKDHSAFQMSELAWMIESSSKGTRHVLWLAWLEKSLKLPIELGDCKPREFQGWHPVREAHFELPGRDNLADAQIFAAQLNEAVDHVCRYADGPCALCGKTPAH